MSPTEERVSAAIEAARKERRLRPEALCVAAGMSRASYYNRLTNGGWRLIELEGVAELLDTTIEDLLGSTSVPVCDRIPAAHNVIALSAWSKKAA